MEYVMTGKTADHEMKAVGAAMTNKKRKNRGW
jgi:hypothetical protein